ncbi:zinc ribbon domain-containing protein [Deinococcus radiopugnans]|uniref:zinc ribbon domain-containing protein n=1 Tax=Deinococcus radiopugnans TaxID=57497 RepID=UPI00361B8EF2
MCQGGLWFLSLAFELDAVSRPQRLGLMGVDVGLAPLAVAAGHGGQMLSTRPLHLLDQAGRHALNSQLDNLPPSQRAEVQTRYAALVYGAAQAELATLTTQLIGCADTVAVEALRFGTFRSNFVERARELAVADWVQGVLPQRIYAAGGRLYRVRPAHTSSRCHRCQQTGQRAGAVFTCARCGVLNAHHNAALNIRRRAWRVIRRGRR